MSQLVRRTDDLRSSFMFPLEQEFNRFFQSFFDPNRLSLDRIVATAGYPKMDVVRENGNFIIRAAIPGISPDEVQVTVSDTHVYISSMSERANETQSSQHYVRELHKSSFSRCIQLPSDVKGEPVAETKHGILTLTWECKENPPPLQKVIPIKHSE